jgi:cyclohexadienyl dehydratase
VAIYVRAEQRELAADLDAWLLTQEASGVLGRMRARYLGSGAAAPTALPVQALLAATAERLALMPLVGAAKQRAGMPIDDAAQAAWRMTMAAAQSNASPMPSWRSARAQRT